MVLKISLKCQTEMVYCTSDRKAAEDRDLCELAKNPLQKHVDVLCHVGAFPLQEIHGTPKGPLVHVSTAETRLEKTFTGLIRVTAPG